MRCGARSPAGGLLGAGLQSVGCADMAGLDAERAMASATLCGMGWELQSYGLVEGLQAGTLRGRWPLAAALKAPAACTAG